MNDIVFDKSARSFVLEAFDKTTDDEGYIVEKNTTNRVIATDGTNVKEDRFAGIRKGSEVYIKSDLISLIELCDDLKDR
jgi:hypothetical protein